MRIAVIGAGASGLAAAIEVKRTDSRHNVMLIEKNLRVGKKILVTGNGRCNLTNLEAKSESYYPSPEFTKPALEAYGVEETLAFFEGLGIHTHTEDGRVYPLSNQASSVLDALRFECDRLGVETICEYAVKRIEKNGKVFVINGNLFFDRVIIACGGKSNPVHGSDGSGYRLLSCFGHTLSDNIRPALVPLVCDNFPKNLKGVRSESACVLFENGEKKVGWTGEVQFTDYGLSGIPIMNLSGFCDIESGKKYTVLLDLVPSLSSDEVSSFITDRIEKDKDGKAENLLSGIVNKQLGIAVLKMCDISQNEFNKNISTSGVKRITAVLKGWSVSVKNTKGFDFSQVTAGGVRTGEFNPETLESRLVSGLYACGEVLDVCAECGGFNLQWAWSSGRLAGKSAAEEA